jgi:hypothetical protein
MILTNGVGYACLGERGVPRVQGLQLRNDVGEGEGLQSSRGVRGFLRGRSYVDMEMVMCGLVWRVC